MSLHLRCGESFGTWRGSAVSMLLKVRCIPFEVSMTKAFVQRFSELSVVATASLVQEEQDERSQVKLSYGKVAGTNSYRQSDVRCQDRSSSPTCGSGPQAAFRAEGTTLHDLREHRPVYLAPIQYYMRKCRTGARSEEGQHVSCPVRVVREATWGNPGDGHHWIN